MATLLERFLVGTPPRQADLVGNWVLVREVWTERFTRGRDGPEHMLLDEKGVRDSTARGKQLNWQLTFITDGAGNLSGISRTTWMSTETSAMSFNAAGELTFAKDYGGDAAYPYRCRAPTAARLICVFDANPPEQGLEFRRSDPPSNEELKLTAVPGSLVE